MRPDQCAIVIPSCRAVSAERLAWIPESTPIYVVSDTTAAIDPVRKGMRVFDLAAQRDLMGRDHDLIPRGSSACRNFGFFYVWHYTDHEYIISLDDDVQPREGFLQSFAHLGERRDLDTAIGPRWFNTLDLLEGCQGLYPRGFPFTERVRTATTWTVTSARVACHMGLWDGILDTHAIDKALFADYREPRPAVALRRELVRIGSPASPVKFPLCSMNFGVIRDALPAMYKFAMPAAFADRYPLGRFEDIWSGYIAQTLIDLRGDASTAGGPIVRHLKQGALDSELAAEHYGMLLSSHLYAFIDDAAADVKAGAYIEMYAHLADRVLTRVLPGAAARQVPPLFRDYIESSFRAIGRWCALHAVSGSGRVRPERISGA